MSELDRRVQSAHGDAWQAEGRLRATLGGGAIELPGIRLMASGLPFPKWNNGDLTDAALADWEAVRRWYAQRANGAGVPWGVRVPAGLPFARGRFLFRKRCMALLPADFARVGALPPGVRIRVAAPADADAVARIDAAAFDDDIEPCRAWTAPHLGAPGFTVALAELNGEPVGCATSILTDERAGRAVGLFGIAVVDHARRRGIGAALTAWLVERGFADGATLAHLNPDSDRVAALYRRLGFVDTAGFDIYVDL